MSRPRGDAFWEANNRAAKRRSTAKANAARLKKMSKAEKETGLTAEQLTEVQRRLKEDFYARMAA